MSNKAPNNASDLLQRSAAEQQNYLRKNLGIGQAQPGH